MLCGRARTHDPLIADAGLKKTRKPQQIVKQSLSHVLKLPNRKISSLQQRRKTEGVKKICQYSLVGTQASVIATRKEEAARQLRNLISPPVPIGSRKSLKILTEDTRSPGAVFDEILDRSG